MSMQNQAASALISDFTAVVENNLGINRHELFAGLRKDLPIFRSDRLDSWVVSRYDDCKEVLSNYNFYQPPQAGAGASAFGRSFMQMSGREHNKKIGIVAREMRSQRAMRDRLEGMVVRIAREQAATLPYGETIDLRERYAMWVPLYAVTELTGLPEAARFRDWYRTIVAGSSSSITNPGAREGAFKAREEVRLFLEPIIDERRKNPGDDLLSDLVTAEYDGVPIPHEEIVSNVIFLLAAGVETTERVLTSMLRHLALDPAEWAWLRANYTDPEALSAFLAEALRFYPPVSVHVRTALQDVAFHDANIKAGDRVCALGISGNRDPDHFADASRFDHDRFAGNGDRQFSGGGDILAFGKGMHHCVGSRLAQLEMEHAFKELLARVGRIEPVGIPPECEGFIFHSPLSLPVVLHPPA